MLDRIVVPVDGPEVSEAILPALPRVIGHGETEIFLLKAERPLLVGPSMIPAGVADAGEGYFDALIPRFFKDPSRVHVIQRRGTPAEAILEAVKSTDASLVAMATHGRRGFSRFVFGSVTESVLHDCPVPLLTIRGDGEPRDVRTILMPVDESTDWKAAAAFAAEIARRHDAQVVALRASAPQGREEAEARVHEICGELVAAGVVAYAFVEDLPAGKAILEAASAHEVDLIVLSSRPGGVAEEVLREARVPMLAVPAAYSTAWVPPELAERD